MQIVKALYPSLLHRTFDFKGRTQMAVSLLWGFDLRSAEPVLEKDLWSTIAEVIGASRMFDIGMPKPRGEFLVHGRFFAPGGAPVAGGRIAARVGPLSKELAVFGDRHWIKGLGIGVSISTPEPMTSMEVSYERAFGGAGFEDNPSGLGYVEIASDDGWVHPLPNVEFPRSLIGSPGDRPAPAAFGRVDQMWRPRLRRAGTHDQRYIEERMPGLADDLDWEFFNDAAPDQWFDDFLTGDETFELTNMHPELATISGRLPSVRGRCFVCQRGADQEPQFREVTTRLDTVWFFPAVCMGIVIHRGTLNVVEDDASDVVELMIAHERLQDPPRSTEHYEHQLRLRAHPRDGAFYVLNTAALIPENCRSELDVLNEQAGADESVAVQNMMAFVDAKVRDATEKINEQKKKMAQHLDAADLDADQALAGFDPAKVAKSDEEKKIRELVEAAIPGAIDDPTNIDFSRIDPKKFDEIRAYVDALIEENKGKAQEMIRDEIARVRQLAEDNPDLNASADDLAQALDNMELPPVLPRIDIDEHMRNVREQVANSKAHVLTLKSMGVTDEDLAAMDHIDVDEVEKKVAAALAEAMSGYRLGAHFMGEARSPHAGRESEIAAELVASHRRGETPGDRDAAFCDLSGQDLQGIDLSNALLEYADLTNADLSGANLSGAVLAFADLTGARFRNTDLRGANLGATRMYETLFEDCDLSGATLARARLHACRFHRCRLLDRPDMFLETHLEHADFNGSDLTKCNLLELDVSHCSFEAADLSGANLVAVTMEGASFAGSVLDGANFVMVKGAGARFDEARMNNTRFVGGCSLQGCSFAGAKADACNFRDCDLQGASFTAAHLERSDLGGADLRDSNFDRAVATLAQFNKADLGGASLERIDLMEGSLYKARLTSARFTGANLYGVNFMGCTAGDTDFTMAHLEQTIFKDWRPA